MRGLIYFEKENIYLKCIKVPRWNIVKLIPINKYMFRVNKNTGFLK